MPMTGNSRLINYDFNTACMVKCGRFVLVFYGIDFVI